VSGLFGLVAATLVPPPVVEFEPSAVVVGSVGDPELHLVTLVVLDDGIELVLGVGAGLAKDLSIIGGVGQGDEGVAGVVAAVSAAQLGGAEEVTLGSLVGRLREADVGDETGAGGVVGPVTDVPVEGAVGRDILGLNDVLVLDPLTAADDLGVEDVEVFVSGLFGLVAATLVPPPVVEFEPSAVVVGSVGDPELHLVTLVVLDNGVELVLGVGAGLAKDNLIVSGVGHGDEGVAGVVASASVAEGKLGISSHELAFGDGRAIGLDF